MKKSKNVAMDLTNNDNVVTHIAIFCPACKMTHAFDLVRWQFNGNYKSPTFTPSMLVNGKIDLKKHPNMKRCHSFVTDGKIKYLGDCTHDMKNQTVELDVY